MKKLAIVVVLAAVAYWLYQNRGKKILGTKIPGAKPTEVEPVYDESKEGLREGKIAAFKSTFAPEYNNLTETYDGLLKFLTISQLDSVLAEKPRGENLLAAVNDMAAKTIKENATLVVNGKPQRIKVA